VYIGQCPTHSGQLRWVDYSASVWQRSGVLWQACMFVCLFAVLSASIFPELHVQTSPNFLCTLYEAVAQSSFGGIATCYLHAVDGLPIMHALWQHVCIVAATSVQGRRRTHGRRHHRSCGSKYIVCILYSCNKMYTLHVYSMRYVTFWQDLDFFTTMWNITAVQVLWSTLLCMQAIVTD